MATEESKRYKGSISSDREAAEQRKRLFTLIVTVGAAAVFLGAFSLYDSVISPFPKQQRANTNQVADLTILKQQDTDSDGLTDYDEIFTYQTSVFVVDSDSDGIADGAEISQKTDPNCPKGRVCNQIVNTNINGSGGTQAIALRTTLQKAGVPASVLDATDDASLLQSYQQVLGGTNVNGVVTGSLSGLSATQVRDLLKSSGLDATTLNQVDDATLLQIFNEVIESQ